jgi:chromosome segregation ATPase
MENLGRGAGAGYGNPVTTTQEQRITDLEADVHRTGHRLDRFKGAIEHLTNAVGDLSQSQRALALDVREIRQDVTELRSDVTELRSDVAKVNATQHEHAARLERIESTLGGHGELLRTILARLSGKPEQGTGA